MNDLWLLPWPIRGLIYVLRDLAALWRDARGRPIGRLNGAAPRAMRAGARTPPVANGLN